LFRDTFAAGEGANSSKHYKQPLSVLKRTCCEAVTNAGAWGNKQSRLLVKSNEKQ
jgi:hypothetical protein